MTSLRFTASMQLPRWAAGAVVLTVVLGWGPARADDGATSGARAQSEAPVSRGAGEVSDIVDELSQEIYSPYCPGKTLAMCPSGGAAEMRRNIQKMARRGLSKAEIKRRVLEKHGREFRLKEPPKEDNYPVIALIVAGLVICIVAVYAFTRRGDADSDSEGESRSEDWSEEEEIYLDELRSHYRD